MRSVLVLLCLATPGLANGMQVNRDIAYAQPKNEASDPRCLRSRPRARTIRSSSGFTAAAGKRATRPTCRSSRKRSWTRASSSFRPTTASCRHVSIKQMARRHGEGDPLGPRPRPAVRRRPERIFVMGHSAGAQLAALVCTDDRYLQGARSSRSRSSRAACRSMATPTTCRCRSATVEQKRKDAYRLKFGSRRSKKE